MCTSIIKFCLKHFQKYRILIVSCCSTWCETIQGQCLDWKLDKFVATSVDFTQIILNLDVSEEQSGMHSLSINDNVNNLDTAPYSELLCAWTLGTKLHPKFWLAVFWFSNNTDAFESVSVIIQLGLVITSGF